MRRNSGFTLVELLVVTALIGVLIALGARVASSPRDRAAAQLLMDVAYRSGAIWKLVNDAAGTSTAIQAGHPLYAAGRDVHDVIFMGRPHVAAANQKFWDAATVKPLSFAATKNAEACPVSGYHVASYCVSLDGGGVSPFVVAYYGVPDSLALKMVQRIDPAAASIPDAGIAVGMVSVSASSGGLRTVLISRDL